MTFFPFLLFKILQKIIRIIDNRWLPLAFTHFFVIKLLQTNHIKFLHLLEKVHLNEIFCRLTLTHFPSSSSSTSQFWAYQKIAWNQLSFTIAFLYCCCCFSTSTYHHHNNCSNYWLYNSLPSHSTATLSCYHLHLHSQSHSHLLSRMAAYIYHWFTEERWRRRRVI